MYNFIDVNEASERTILPSEALKINGEYIENQITGYRTVHVSGREALAPELSTYTTGVRDGSVLKNKRFPARTITVTYQIVANSSEDYRKAYNKLAAILNVENAQLIFNDEQDKYFVGTPSAIGTPEPGRNAVIGEFEILCVDPFKYSVVEYTAEPIATDGTFLVDYGGTYKSYPKLEAEFYKETEISEDGESVNALTGNGDCGYVAFINDRKKIIQLGDPGETDKETFADKKQQTLIINKFNKETDWGKGAQSLWVQNQANLSGFPSLYEQAGSMAMQYLYPAVWDKKSGKRQQILSVKSKVGSLATYPIGFPGFTYDVYTQVIHRTASSATIQVTVDVSMWEERNYFGYSLNAFLKIRGTWYKITLRKDSDPTWYGKGKHSIFAIIYVYDLQSTSGKIGSVKFKVTRGDNNGSAGTIAETNCKDIEYLAYTTVQENKTCFLGVSDYSNGKGPSIYRPIPKDFLGYSGAKDFTVLFNLHIQGEIAQTGLFQMNVCNHTKGSIALEVAKSAGKKTADVEIYSLGHTNNVRASTYNGDFPKLTVNGEIHTFNVAVRKIGKQLTLVGDLFGGKVYTFPISDDITFERIEFYFTHYSSGPPVSRFGISHVQFIKSNCNNIKDIPNKFGSNDVLNVDCGSGEIILNGTQHPELGALGNDWEEFYLEPGLNQMTYAYSEWVPDEYAPKVRIRYREVFL